MELSKEEYTAPIENLSEIQSAIKDIMNDDKIIQNANKSTESQQDKLIEKKKRGRPPKKIETTIDKPIIKKPRGRPRKKPSTPPPSTPLHINNDDDNNNNNNDDNDNDNNTNTSHIDPLIQHIISQHHIQNIPHNTLKYIIFLIHLFHHTTPPPPTPLTLHSLIHHTLTHFHPHLLTHTTPHIKHTLFNCTQNT